PRLVGAAAASPEYESAVAERRSSHCVHKASMLVPARLLVPVAGRGKTAIGRGGCAARGCCIAAHRAARSPRRKACPRPVGCGNGAGGGTARYPGGRKNPATRG